MNKCRRCGKDRKKNGHYCSRKCFYAAVHDKPDGHAECGSCVHRKNICVLCMYKSMEEDMEDNRHVCLNRSMAIKRGARKVSGGGIRISVGEITEKGKKKQQEGLKELNKMHKQQMKEIIEDKRAAHPKGWNTKKGRRVN